MKHARAYAKINLGLVVGSLREDGKHEVVTVLQRIDLHDDVAIEPADGLTVEGYEEDTIVRGALEALSLAAEVRPRWRVRIRKRIPVAAGLGGGSADAAAALALANEQLPRPLSPEALHRIAAGVGADVPFFLRSGAQLATGDGTELEPIRLPTDYHVLVVVPDAVTKTSTRAVYDAFAARGGAAGFDTRAKNFRRALGSISKRTDLAAFPRNDLQSSSLVDELRAAGAFRADVSGAGPTVYGLFETGEWSERARRVLRRRGTTVLARPID